jgi:hypothetical protein
MININKINNLIYMIIKKRKFNLILVIIILEFYIYSYNNFCLKCIKDFKYNQKCLKCSNE